MSDDLIARLRGDFDYMEDEWAVMNEAADEIERLTAERDALRADAERLDWIECNVMNGKLEIAQSILKRGYEFGFHQAHKQGAVVKNGTLREAIDAARRT